MNVHESSLKKKHGSHFAVSKWQSVVLKLQHQHKNGIGIIFIKYIQKGAQANLLIKFKEDFNTFVLCGIGKNFISLQHLIKFIAMSDKISWI